MSVVFLNFTSPKSSSLCCLRYHKNLITIPALFYFAVVQSHKLCPALRDYSPPCSSVHGVFQARILEWVAISFSRASSWPRIEPASPALTGRFFTSELCLLPRWQQWWRTCLSGDIGVVGLIPGSGRSLEKETADHSGILAWFILLQLFPIASFQIWPSSYLALQIQRYYFSVNSLFFSQLLFQYPRCLSMEGNDLPSTPSLHLVYSHPSYFNSNIVCFAESSPPPKHLR